MLLGTGYQFAAFQQLAEVLACLYLSLVRTNLLDAVHEGVDASVEGFQGKGGNQVGFHGKTEGLEKGKDTVGTHELGAVEQRQSFLAHQFHRLPAELVEHTDSLAFLTFIIDIAHTDKRQEEVCQGSQVAGGAERAAVINDRHHVVIKEVEDALHGDDLHTAMPQREGMRLEQHHQLDDDGTYLLAHTASMALDEILLQGAQLVRRDVLAAQRTETGGNAIQGFFRLRNLLVQIIAALLYPQLGFRSQLQFQVFVDDAFDEVEGQLTGTYIIDIVHTFSS